MGRIVGIDFGLTRLGTAVSDEKHRIALPMTTILAGKNAEQTCALVAKALASYPQIDQIVIGLPLLLNGKEGEMAQKVRAFAALLGEKLSFPIVFWDERLTSCGVDKMLIDCKVKRKKRAQLSDVLSAVSILQNYLDARNFS